MAVQITWHRQEDFVTGTMQGTTVVEVERLSKSVWEVVVRPPHGTAQVEGFSTLGLAKAWATKVVNQTEGWDQ